MKRVGLSKKLRFSVFARDSFSCRYCGRQSDQVVLNVDHIIPVAKGGTNDEANLVTACFDCNSGKSDTAISHAAPTESDRLRLAQEMNEQKQAAMAAKAAREAKEVVSDALLDYWCECTGRDSVDRGTFYTVLSYVQEFGIETVFGWIDKAIGKCGPSSDRSIGRYISGIRRLTLSKTEAEERRLEEEDDEDEDPFPQPECFGNQ